MIADEMLANKYDGITRPLNWSEFCKRYAEGGVLHELTDLVAGQFRFIFDDTNPRTTPPRRAMQCRLAILALYLIHLSEENGNMFWTRRTDGIWSVVTNWFKWEREQTQKPQWFVFKFGDVEEHLKSMN